MRMLRTFSSSLDSVCKWLAIVSSFSIVIIMVALVSDVLRRWLMNNPIEGVTEVSGLLMSAVIFLGLAYTQARGGHMRADFLPQRLGGKGQAVLDFGALFLMLCLFTVVIAISGEKTYESIQIREITAGTIPFPWWPARLMIPIGSVFLWMQALKQALQILRRRGMNP